MLTHLWHVQLAKDNDNDLEKNVYFSWIDDAFVEERKLTRPTEALFAEYVLILWLKKQRLATAEELREPWDCCVVGLGLLLWKIDRTENIAVPFGAREQSTLHASKWYPIVWRTS